ncbi:CBS domain-containing protein [Microbacterium sp. NPDC056569]|uniref:CBS domain-containing protein n=1 Tax=Microbacterium sp. NPDC056569 TaxID=3345867 RepID=UPI00366D28F4
MTTARDIMTTAPRCVGENETLVDAARLMASLDVGALPICGDDKKLKGMLTDRDIVLKCVAEGGDPASTTAGSLGEGKPVTVGAEDDIEAVLEVMKRHQIRRVPVIEDHELVGIISQADVALSLAPAEAGEAVAQISS